MTTSFNLSGLATGTYGLRVTVPGGASSTLSASFQVLPAGQGKLETKLILPPALGRSANATIYVEYANTGSAAMPAPLLTLQSADLDNSDRPWMTLDSSRLIAGFWTDAQPDGFAHSVQIYASGATPGFLQPGERIQIPVYYVGLQQPYNLSDGTVELEILINDVETTTPFDWAGLRDFLRPNWISPEAWPAVYANLQLAVGSTWGDYVRMLGDNATYLARLGENVTDASELYSFELQQALANSPVGVLAGAVDAAVAVPGVSLSFSRYFATNLAQRSETGSFGRGWIAPWQTAIKIENEGIVVVSDAAGSQRRFQPDRRFLYGTYFSAAGDYGTLHRDGSGAFTLTEVTGEVAHFRADGFLEYVEDADHNRVTLDYTSGRLTQLTHSNGATLAIAYNSAGHIGSITDSAGRVATYVYDLSNNYLLSVNTVAGTTNYSYNMTGASAQIGTLATISDSTGVTQSFAYDNHGRLIDTFTGANLNRFDFAYDSAGGISTTDPSGAVSQIFVDHRGLVVRSESSNGYYENYTYDGKRQLMQIADALGRTTRYGYASQGAVVSVTDVLGLTTKFLPGGTNNAPSTFVDGNGNITRYDYSGKGLSKTTYPNGTVERISYDGQGDVLSFTNRRGESIFRTYNTAGQLTSEQFLDGTQNTYTYDSLNRLKTIVDPTGTTSFTYDAHDRITRIASPQGRWLEYEYDSANRRTKMTDQLGVVTRYVYDSIGRLSELRDTANAIVIKYTYDSAGRLSREDKGNGTYTINTYDVFSRIVSIYHYAPDGSVNSKFVYGYDLLGRRTSMETSDGSWSYTYDLSGQLTRATFASTNMLIPNQDLNYEYDALGNRVRTVLNGVETGYVTNSMNQYVSAGGVTFKYDLDGNLIEESGPDGTTLYTYNALSQLTQVVSPDGTTNYTYDGLGNRKSVVTNGTETQFVWDPFGLSNVVAEYNGQGSQTSWFVNGYGLESAQSVNGRAYYDFDAIGSTNGLSNESGAYVNKYAYDPYGNEILSTESIANQNEFVGQSGVANDGSGLYYMRARYYIGEFGRFDSQDPIRLLGGDFNQYRYGHNDPANQADPLGLFTIDVGLSGGLGLGGTVGIVVDSAGGAGVYVGIGATTPGVGGSVNIGGGNVSNGGSVQIQGGIGGGVGVAGSGSVGSDGSVGGSVGVGVGAGGSKVTGIGGYIVYTVPVPAGKIFNWLFPPGGPSGQGGDGTPAAKPVPIPTPPAGKKGDSGSRNNVVSRDPNEKFGASGYGPAAFIPADSVIPYRINFENLGPGTVPAPTQPATAPAQRIEVTDQLSNTLDWATFTFTEFGFGDTVVSLSESIKHAFETVPVTYNDQTFDVQVELDFDSITGLMRVVFQSVDPLTELPPDVLTGFLPPEDGTGRGKGHLAYSIEVEPGLATGTEIRNIASIIFDGQTAIATNQIDPQDPVAGTSPAKEALNTIDAAAPSSSVNALAATVSSTFTVNWTGVDDAGGSGIAFYDIYVAIDGGSYALWLDDAVGTSASCTGSVGHTYHFYSVATDNVGHSESAPAAADAQTRTDSSNQSPQILDAVFSLPENSGLNTVVGIPNSIDPDAADVLTYNIISGNVAGAFVINPATGAISVANPALLNFETTPSFALTVQVTDNHGAADTASVSVNLTNVNEAPTDIGLSANNIAENNTANSTVGILSATDVDGGSSFTYSLVAGAGSTDNSSFTIVGDTLKITPSADFETKGSYAIRVRVSDQGGQTVEKPFTISITDLNESPTISSIVNLSMPENGAPSVVNFVIGDAETPAGSLTVSATSSNASLIPNANLIVGGAGANRSLTISPTANQSGSTTITVTVSDGLRSSIQTFQVTVQPVGNTPAIGLNRLPLVRVSAKKVEAIDGSATLTGIDGPVLTFNGAVVTVSGQSAKDALSILKQNGIARKGKNVVFGKTIIGSISGGKKGAGLTINLNASASQSSVQALLRSVGFKSTDKVGGHRTIKMQITNLGGLSTNQATRQIQIGL
jgi:RHS repeat-associated protein